MGHLKKTPDNLVMFSDVQGQLTDSLYNINVFYIFEPFKLQLFDLSNICLYTFLNV